MARRKRIPISLEEEFELLGRISETISDAQDMLLVLEIAPLRIRELKGALAVVHRVAQEHYMAADIMLNSELAVAFPNGEVAPPTLTPRQVMYLAALNYQRPSRELVGLPASRPCSKLTSAGDKCGSSSLVFTSRAVCWSHATPAERERNRKQKDKWNSEHPDYKI